MATGEKRGPQGKSARSGDFTVYVWRQFTDDASDPARDARHGGRRTLTDGDNWRCWGSWHPLICQFAFGDGRVDAISSYQSGVTGNLCRRSYGNTTNITGM